VYVDSSGKFAGVFGRGRFNRYVLQEVVENQPVRVEYKPRIHGGAHDASSIEAVNVADAGHGVFHCLLRWTCLAR